MSENQGERRENLPAHVCRSAVSTYHLLCYNVLVYFLIHNCGSHEIHKSFFLFSLLALLKKRHHIRECTEKQLESEEVLLNVPLPTIRCTTISQQAAALLKFESKE
jgi:hypothetical protein